MSAQAGDWRERGWGGGEVFARVEQRINNLKLSWCDLRTVASSAHTSRRKRSSVIYTWLPGNQTRLADLVGTG